MICSNLPAGIIHLQLRTHLPQLCREVGNRRFQFLDSSVLFEKLIKQHRVQFLVTYAVGFAILVPHHQIRIELRDLPKP